MPKQRNCVLQSLFFAFFALCCGSCIYDRYDDGEQDATQGQEAFFSVSIVFSDDRDTETTRADFDGSDTSQDNGLFFNNGIEDESRISEQDGANWLLAYDASGGLLARYQLSTFEETSQDRTGKTYKALCHITGNTGILSDIASARIVLNANSDLRSLINSGQPLEGATIGQSSPGDVGYLFRTESGSSGAIALNTMSSSMIVEGSGWNAATRPAAVIGDLTKYYPTAREALDNPCATLFVERMQAKYTVLFHPVSYSIYDQFFQDGNVWNYNIYNPAYSQSTEKTIIFTPQYSRRVYYVNDFDATKQTEPVVERGYWKASIVGWDINATEPSEFLFKSLGTYPADFTGKNFTPWGYSYPIRNIWAVDPTYSNGPEAYPDQYRDAFDKRTTAQKPDLSPYEGNESQYNLNYLSFNRLTQRHIRRYSAENTYDAPSALGSNAADRLASRAQYRCGNHLLIGAQLLIEGLDPSAIYNPSEVDENGLIKSGETRVASKYFMDNIYWSERAYINYYAMHLGNNLDATTPCISDLTANTPFIPNDVFKPATNDAVFYVYDGGNWRPADYRDFTIAPVYIVGGDGWCYPVPWKDPANQTNTILYVRQENGFRQITMEEYDKLAYGFPFYFAKGYTEGRMYYAVPISNDSSRENASDFGQRTGDLGAVRNHWYHYRFTSLTSVGVPVQNPDQPIVPNNEPSLLGLGFEVRIIPWHVVDVDVNI